MAMPSRPFLLGSQAKWKRRHTYRTTRLKLWARRESYRYRKWDKYRDTLEGGHKLRAKWWRLYRAADIAVDKWVGLRDEASTNLARRRRQLDEHGERASANFLIEEFNCKDGTPVPRSAHAGVRGLCGEVLEPMRNRFGPCRVTSGYRHRSYNAGIGGATRSFHIYDLRPAQPAADVVFARGTPAQWAAYARQLGKGGVGQYASFVHCDTGPRRTWRG
jgi:hypothetical protein